jgi:hypothetical protein
VTTIQAQLLGENALLPRSDFDRLVEIARRSEQIELEVFGGALSTQDMMRLAEQSGAFDFWNHPEEAIYSLTDGEPI